MSDPIDLTADVLDSRDIIERIEYLSVIRQPGPVPDGLLDDDDATEDQDVLFHELAALEAFAEEASGASDWEYGATFIRDSYFTDYARELASDIGAIPDAENAWPTYCIDWEWAARELRMDYSAYDLDGVTYWSRD